MTDSGLDNLEERVIILRDKAAREGIDIPDEVIDFMAYKYSVPQALKGALINVSAYAMRRGIPISLEVAEHVLDGTRRNRDKKPIVESYGDSIGPLPELMEDDAVEAGPIVSDFAEPDLDIEPAGRQFDAPAFSQNIEPISAWKACSEPDAPLFSYEEYLESATAEECPVVTTAAVEDISIAPISEAKSQGDDVAQPAEVYFVPMRTERKRSLTERAGSALVHAGLGDVISEGDKVAIKVHFGEKGNTSFVSPIYVREVVRLVKEAGGKPFLTDANTLYSGQRDNAIDHIECAIHNGFSYSTVEAPIIISDGIDGRDGVDIPICGGKHFESVRLGSASVHADAMVVISHVKGHGEAGFGGAIKNVGMGLGTRAAKQRMHSVVKPNVKAEKCTRCGRCVRWCPVACISLGQNREDKAIIDPQACIGCGECVAACSYGAIGVEWGSDKNAFQERIVEHAYGLFAEKGDKTIYLNFLTDISPECDCWSFSDASIVPDIGILASRDIVAIEQASYDMVTEAVGSVGSVGEGLASGVDKFNAIHEIDGQVAIAYAESLGMGSRDYSIKKIG